MREVIRHLRAAALFTKGDGPTDGQLLEYFVLRRDEQAFEALVRRHGPMVLAVCRRVLRHLHDAEDAFQATFLVLARKADSVKPPEMVGNWLYGVAYRTALKARTMNAKRRKKEKQAGELPRPESSPDEELLAQLDHALNRLPDKYRLPVVLCELEGRSRKEAALLLSVPEGRLSWRLAQAKKMLAKRLSRYGPAVSVGSLATAMVPGSVSAFLRTSTVETALTAGTIPAHVLALTEGVMKAMLLSKLKITLCAGALMLLAGVGASGVAYRAVAQEPTRTESVALSIRNVAGSSAADELEALRSEIEALRKSLQATRERVKTLEGEVSALKGKRGGAAGSGIAGGPPGMQGVGSGQGGGPPGSRGSTGTQPSRPGAGNSGASSPPGADGKNTNNNPPTSDKKAKYDFVYPGTGSKSGSTWAKRTSDPVRDAEAALEKLRSNPSDKQAVDALERALKRLKEREKPKQPDPNYLEPRK